MKRAAPPKAAKGAPRIPRQSETKVQRAIQRVLSLAAPDLMIMRNAQGRAGKGRAGLGTGSADLVGVLRLNLAEHYRECQSCAAKPGAPTLCERCLRARAILWHYMGRFFALEIKAADGVVSDEQTAWLLEVRLMGGFAAVVTSPEEAMQALERARKGASE